MLHFQSITYVYLHLPGTLIARRKRIFRGILANFCKSKKCIIFNIDYRPGSKKSKFDMTLIRHSPVLLNEIIQCNNYFLCFFNLTMVN